MSKLVPYVPAEAHMPELTVRAVVLGCALSVTFGMVNAYLGLRVGLTVSASIPSAVLSMAVLRGILRRGTVLENNVVHTIASTGESLAAGVIFTLPALVFLELAPTGFQIFLFGATAGVLGILMMIPLRHSLMIDRHGELPFPEGTACAKVLIAGDRGGESALPVFLGIGGGALYGFAAKALHLWKETVFWSFSSFHKASFGMELTPLFLGVGYLVGPRIASTMLAGGLVGWTVLIPVFDALGNRGAWLGLPPYVGTLGPWEIWSEVVRYVGAGAVTMGGIVSLVRSAPAMRASIAHLGGGFGRRDDPGDRTERDIPSAVVLAGVTVAGLALWLVPWFEMTLLDSVFAVAFTFLFVVVSAEIVGLVGTTSQPVSGMTITALLVTAFAILASGDTGPEGSAAAIRVAAIVAIAIALAGDMSQDLKTGALLGATPRRLQIGQMIGAAVAALRAGWVLFLLHEAYGLGSEILPAPQAKLMATLAAGVMEGDLPWGLLSLGAAIAGGVELFGVASLPFAIGLYLPVTTSAGLIAGGLIAGILGHGGAPGSGEGTPFREKLTLLASGLVAGDALMGIAVAGLVVGGVAPALSLRTPGDGAAEILFTLVPFLAFAAAFVAIGRGLSRRRAGSP